MRPPAGQTPHLRVLLRGAPEYPTLLDRIPDPPALLYVRGDLALLRRPAVAIVGTRRASREGLLFAESLATDLTARGLVVVSGLAFGIDAAAHRGALAAGPTVAVLASGVDVPSPRGNRALYERILQSGAVLSELPNGTQPRAHYYLKRNRIISGLALGTVVVEAAERSGALTTARHAREQDREVFAVPGSPLRETSAGPNALLKDGAALVRGWEDVVGELRVHLEATLERHANGAEAGATAKSPRSTSTSPAHASGGILSRLTREPQHVDELQAVAGRTISEVLAELAELEIQGVVRQLPGKYFVLP